jgi:hypothetical protein
MTPMLPDFTCNQLSVDIQDGKLDILHTSSSPIDPWWKSGNVYNMIIDHDNSFLSGIPPIMSCIQKQIEQKITHILLYNYSSWFKICKEYRIDTNPKEYLIYVRRIICYRMRKLLDEGWEILGLHPTIDRQGFICEHNQNDEITDFNTMHFSHHKPPNCEYVDIGCSDKDVEQGDVVIGCSDKGVDQEDVVIGCSDKGVDQEDVPSYFCTCCAKWHVLFMV